MFGEVLPCVFVSIFAITNLPDRLLLIQPKVANRLLLANTRGTEKDGPQTQADHTPLLFGQAKIMVVVGNQAR